MSSLKVGTELKYLEGKAVMIGNFYHLFCNFFLGSTKWIVVHEDWVDIVDKKDAKLDKDTTKYRPATVSNQFASATIKRENSATASDDTPKKYRPC